MFTYSIATVTHDGVIINHKGKFEFNNNGKNVLIILDNNIFEIVGNQVYLRPGKVMRAVGYQFIVKTEHISDRKIYPSHISGGDYRFNDVKEVYVTFYLK